MRIAITVDPYIPVPPRLYGGIERVADLAVRGLVARGHEVTLFAHPESRAGVPLVPYGVPPHTGAGDAPLVFLGRLERIKGAHAAIAIAKGSGRRLILAGNHATSGPESTYFHQEIAPHVDSNRITYVGPVDDDAKDRLLGSAAAL